MSRERIAELDRRLEDNEVETERLRKAYNDLEEDERRIQADVSKMRRFLDESRGWQGEQANRFHGSIEEKLMDNAGSSRRRIDQTRDQLQDRLLWLEHERRQLQEERDAAEED